MAQFRRSIVVGDVHGCLQELDELLQLVEFVQSKDELIFVGDLVDRGPDSAGAVRRARELNAFCVLGNHEAKHLRYRQQLAEGKVRVQMNANKLEVEASISAEEWEWIASWPLYHRIDDKLVVVHAGVQRGVPLAEQDQRTLTMVRYVERATGKMVPMQLKHDKMLRPATAAFWVELWTGPESVIYGHYIIGRSPVVDEPVPGVFCYGIDTGCYSGKALSCAIVRDGEVTFASVPARGVWGKHFTEEVIDDE